MKQKRILIFLIIIFMFLTILLVGCNNNENPENNLIVIKGKNQTYSTINEALNNAIKNDIILVPEGTYNETLTINKTISLVGENKNKTIISGNKMDDVINIFADYVNISGFTIINSGPEPFQNIDAGIDVRSNYNTISHCNIISNENYGIYLHLSTKGNKIISNLIYDNIDGIYITTGTENVISSNNISNNKEYGIFLVQSNDNLILSNIFYNNQYAVRIKGSQNNVLAENYITNNPNGLYFCCGASYNYVYKNAFINNTNWHVNDYLQNYFDNGSIGNYWDDYTGIDENGDGIGNTPYRILGGSNQDNYPIIDKKSIDIF